jgi:hypothetical protein
MTDIRTPQPSLSIGSRQTIRPTGAGVVSNWNPQAGLDRQTEIEQARQKELEDYQKRVEDATTLGVRVSRLEEELRSINADIAKILSILHKS